jgi:hypothetical protein
MGCALASRASPTVSTAPPTEARTRIATTGERSQRLRPRRCRLTPTAVNTATASRAGGHTQFSTGRISSPATSKASPDTTWNKAGTQAHPWDGAEKDLDNTASRAQPSPNPSRIAPVTASSVAATKGADTSAVAARRPVASEATTIQPVRPRGRTFLAPAGGAA